MMNVSLLQLGKPSGFKEYLFSSVTLETMDGPLLTPGSLQPLSKAIH